MSVAFAREIKIPRVVERKELGLPPAYIVAAEDLFQTYMPWTAKPLSEAMSISGFMDIEGNIHFEFNHSTFDPKKYLTFKSLLQPARYYRALVEEFLQTSVVYHEKRLVSGGHAIYNFETKECHLMNLVILPRPLCPEMDPEIRKKAIFLFQEAFDQMVVRMGGEVARTATLVIPNERMEALGWNLLKTKGFNEMWTSFREWWPISLRGLQRSYTKQLGNLAAPGGR